MARNRRVDVFTLSFLDCIACGFGAVILLFFIINHSTEVRSDEVNRELLAQAKQLEQQLLAGEKNRVRLKNSLAEIKAQQVVSEGRSRQIIQELTKTEAELAELTKETTARREHIARLMADVQAAEEEAKRLEGSVGGHEDQGDEIRSFTGQGDRQYLTGLKVGGERILILIDASASMLDETIVNIIRRRNLPNAQKLTAPKWQRAIATADWIAAQIPIGTAFQIYTFNVDTTPLLKGTAGKWQTAEHGRGLSQAIENLRAVVPQAGTSLHQPLAVVTKLKPAPDTVYLLTDGLPTQGEGEPTEGTVSSEARLRLFAEAVQDLPLGIPVNVILFPLEGDPMAASAYWQLAQATRGAFLSPSRDWP